METIYIHKSVSQPGRKYNLQSLCLESRRVNLSRQVVWEIDSWEISQMPAFIYLFLYFVSAIAGGWCSSPLSEAHLNDFHQDCWHIFRLSYKRHHPRIASCCLRVGQQPLQSQCFCSPRVDLCPAECWTLGKWSWAWVQGPGEPPCCCHRSGHGCCTGAVGRWRSRHPAETETRGDFVQLWRDIYSTSQSGSYGKY